MKAKSPKTPAKATRRIPAERPINVSVKPTLEERGPREDHQRAYGPDASYHLYLREIGRTALLTPKEEIALAKRIHKGDSKARERMIKANLRLVVKIARDYEGFGLPLLDLINEGNIGLMKAVERFDPNKGAKLSTYAAWWIKQSIKRGLADQGKTIRLPVHVVDKLFSIRRAEAKLHDILGREPSLGELSQELGMPVSKISQMRRAAIRPASLEAPLGDDDTNRIADVVADENATNPFEELREKADVNLIREIIKDLDPRELSILNQRFGLNGEDSKTLEEVGEQFGVTRERIRQLQNIALQKLRRKLQKLDSVQLAA